jgi:hypothetical protein
MMHGDPTLAFDGKGVLRGEYEVGSQTDAAEREAPDAESRGALARPHGGENGANDARRRPRRTAPRT